MFVFKFEVEPLFTVVSLFWEETIWPLLPCVKSLLDASYSVPGSTLRGRYCVD
jgi:hypothetical protein